MNALEQLRELLASLDALPALERVRVGQEVYDQLLEAQARVAGARRSGVREARAEGLLLREIADAVGTTPQRVHQLEIGFGRAEKRLRANR